MSIADLPKQYDPHEAERKWYALWLDRGYFTAHPESEKPPFTIVIPPPNVTGALHLGHALNNTLQDILTRWRRMQGYDALWMPGTDHAGIATQAVVERRIFEEEGKNRHDLGREALVERIWAWKDEYEARILSQLQQMGCSCDWSRTRFTLDDVCSKAVRRTFFNLFKAGKIFRGKRLVNWDTQLRTAVADDEIYYEDIQGHLWTIKYPVAGSETEALNVSTTRPETMLGDTAVAVHPDDPRYQHLIGKEVELPLTGRRIPILADPILVDPQFGTGCVKVTPAHDPNDYQTGLRHDLPMINLLNSDGTYNENAGAYAGLPGKEVRKRVVADLEAQGLLVKAEPYATRVNYSDRSKTPIEPFLSDQWFVRMGDDEDGSPGFAQQAIDAVTSGKVRITPDRYSKSYIDWLSEKRDWCISRQLWWGHRIPIWHCETGSESDLQRAFGDRPDVSWHPSEAGGWLVCSESDLPSDALGPDHTLTQDPDVLDTWFSSALWPHSTLGWPEKTPELAKYYPTSVLSTARDIITLWVARMVIFGQFNVENIPFRDVFIHPVIQDGDGKRMSKTAGNGIDPVDIIEAYGADALRFTLALSATETQDLRIPVEPVKNDQGRLAYRSGPDGSTEWLTPEQAKTTPKRLRVNTSERFEQGRTFPNKFWNSARFALMNMEGYTPGHVDLSLSAHRGPLDSGRPRRHHRRRHHRPRSLPLRRRHPNPPRLHLELLLRLVRRVPQGPTPRRIHPPGRPARAGRRARRPLPPPPPRHALRHRIRLGSIGASGPHSRPARARSGRGIRLHRRLARPGRLLRPRGRRNRPPVAGKNPGDPQPPRRTQRPRHRQNFPDHRGRPHRCRPPALRRVPHPHPHRCRVPGDRPLRRPPQRCRRLRPLRRRDHPAALRPHRQGRRTRPPDQTTRRPGQTAFRSPFQAQQRELRLPGPRLRGRPAAPEGIRIARPAPGRGSPPGGPFMNLRHSRKRRRAPIWTRFLDPGASAPPSSQPCNLRRPDSMR